MYDSILYYYAVQSVTISFHYRVLDQSVVLAMIVGLNSLGEHQLMLYQDVRHY